MNFAPKRLKNDEISLVTIKFEQSLLFSPPNAEEQFFIEQAAIFVASNPEFLESTDQSAIRFLQNILSVSFLSDLLERLERVVGEDPAVVVFRRKYLEFVYVLCAQHLESTSTRASTISGTTDEGSSTTTAESATALAAKHAARITLIERLEEWKDSEKFTSIVARSPSGRSKNQKRKAGSSYGQISGPRYGSIVIRTFRDTVNAFYAAVQTAYYSVGEFEILDIALSEDNGHAPQPAIDAARKISAEIKVVFLFQEHDVRDLWVNVFDLYFFRLVVLEGFLQQYRLEGSEAESGAAVLEAAGWNPGKYAEFGQACVPSGRAVQEVLVELLQLYEKFRDEPQAGMHEGTPQLVATFKSIAGIE